MKDDIFDLHINNHLQAIEDIKNLRSGILNLAVMIANTFSNGNKVFICGNGGSSSDALHIVGELIGRYKSNRTPLAAISLNSDVSVMTCIANDFGYEEVFSRQLHGLSSKGDFVIGISTSGNSKNIINCINTANMLGLENACFLGRDGGALKSITTHPLIVNSDFTASIQEMHIVMGHILCSLVENIIFGIDTNE